MPSKTFTIDDFNLSSSWVYAERYDDVGDVTIDYKSGGGASTADKTFTIADVDMSTINSIVLTWDTSAKAYGSISTPSAGYGASYSRVYQGASTSGTYVSGTSEKMDLTSYVGTNTSFTLRFYYKPGIQQSDHDHYQGYGLGDCTGTVYFKNVTLTVTYGEERDDAGMGLWLGNTSNLASAMKGMWIGDENGKARKVKAAWIGVNGVARLFYQASIKSLATGGYYRTSSDSSTSTGQLTVRSSGDGYAAYVFPAEEKYSTCSKVTLNFYINSSYGKMNIYVRSGSSSWVSYNTGLAKNIPEFSPSGNGWQSVDITADFDPASAGVTRANAAANGLKIYFRGSSNTKLAGTSTEQCPYITIE